MYVQHTNIIAVEDDILATYTALGSGDPCSSTDGRNNQPESDAGECYVITLFTKCLNAFYPCMYIQYTL